MSHGRPGDYWPLEWMPPAPASLDHSGARFVFPRQYGTYGGWIPRQFRMPHGLDPVFTRTQEALAMVDHFERVGAPGVFSQIRNRDVAAGLRLRLADPTTIDQGTSRLCGPAAFVYTLRTHDPVEYVRFVTSLYLGGNATIGRLVIRAGSDVRAFNPFGRVSAVDWIALASIRDSENWFFDYQSDDNAFPGITLPRELASWFTRVGYSIVINKTSLTHDENEANLREADRLFGEGFWVCLLVNADVLYGSSQTNVAIVPDHWIVLRSRIQFGQNIQMEVFTWGDGHRSLPQTGAPSLSTATFLDHYNGFVAAKG
jgi:hypothetical protein